MHIPPINKLDPQQQAFLDKVSALLIIPVLVSVINGFRVLQVQVNLYY